MNVETADEGGRLCGRASGDTRKNSNLANQINNLNRLPPLPTRPPPALGAEPRAKAPSDMAQNKCYRNEVIAPVR